ncbi:MAG: hypothetical protein AB1Z67_01710 [Candidatus Limnocylindrales bacterium]
MGRIKRRDFDAPDELRQMPLASLGLIRLGSVTIGLGRVQPGWRWSTHAKVFALVD